MPDPDNNSSERNELNSAPSSHPLPANLRRYFRVNTVDEMWTRLMTQGDPMSKQSRRFHRLIPSTPRCNSCYTPFGGFGGKLARLGIYGSLPSKKNPRYCDACEAFYQKFPGGAEVTLTMLFVDVRGSSSIAERTNAHVFSQLMNRFYEATIDVLIHADALIDKLVGDEVTALFVPGYAGQEHARRAIEAGQELLRVTGHTDPDGPWIPVGVGVHTGTAWVGSIAGASGAGSDFTALGDNVNIAARLASLAGAGEVLASEAACVAASIDTSALEKRDLELKGKSEPVSVRVLRAE